MSIEDISVPLINVMTAFFTVAAGVWFISVQITKLRNMFDQKFCDVSDQISSLRLDIAKNHVTKEELIAATSSNRDAIDRALGVVHELDTRVAVIESQSGEPSVAG